MFQNQQINFPLLIVIGTITFLVFVVGIFIIIKAYQKSIIKNILEKQRLQSQFSQSLLQSQIEIQEQTLQHISRELHDNLGQVASLIKINLNTLLLSDTQKTESKIEDTKDLTRQLIADIKSLSVSLGSDRISQVGLVKAIETELERLNKTGQFTATYELLGVVPEIDKDKSVILYRMAQEVLNNMVKHSRAKQISISLLVKDNILTLLFRDNGIGFDVEQQENGSGAGFRNLKNRALLINAKLHVQSVPGNGTSITIELPI